MEYIWSRSLISGVISKRKSPTVSHGLHPRQRWFGALTGHLSSRLHWRQISPSNIAWSELLFLLLWLSILWSIGLWPIGHLVAKPSELNWKRSLPMISSDKRLRLTGEMNSICFSVIFSAEGTEGYPPSAKRVSGLIPAASKRSITERALPTSDRAAPCTS